MSETRLRPRIWKTTRTAGPSDSGELRRIGPYKILQKLGEGGMGIVYLAEQEKPIRRRVALKLIKMGHGHDQAVVARFEAERQALALMNHPNVAKSVRCWCYGTGTALLRQWNTSRECRSPSYCDRHRLTTRERLAGCSCKACEGVQHAHQKGDHSSGISNRPTSSSQIDDDKVCP